MKAIFQVQHPAGGGAYIWRGDLTEGFLRHQFGGLIHGGAYFRYFTVSQTEVGIKFNRGKLALVM